MKRKYTKRQITEAIKRWEKVLEGMPADEDGDSWHIFRCDISFDYAGEGGIPDDADVEVVPDDDFDSELQYNSSLPPEQRKKLVRRSQAYLGYDPGDDEDDDASRESFHYSGEALDVPEFAEQACEEFVGEYYHDRVSGISAKCVDETTGEDCSAEFKAEFMKVLGTY